MKPWEIDKKKNELVEKLHADDLESDVMTLEEVRELV